MINRLCDFVDNKLALEPTTLSSFLAIVLTEVEIQRFLSVTWSLDHELKASKDFMDGDPLL